MRHILATIILVSLLISSCYKESFETSSGVQLEFSADTVTFDTIFTEIGSVTKNVRIYNKEDKSLKINSIRLAGGEQSPYRLNVNGVPGKEFNDITIRPEDSIFVFVDVTIDPLNNNSPLIVSDSIFFYTNTNEQKIQLIAFGQDVHLLNAEMVETQTWRNDKPYLIYNNAAVDTGEILTIEAGTQIYMHANSSLLIYGSLKTNGTYAEPIVFTGDRLDAGYRISAGQWGTIYFDPDSKNNTLNYTIIKNAIAGVQAGFPGEQEGMVDVTLTNCQILNSSFAGIYAFYADIKAYNTVIADCGSYLLSIFQGGTYNFWHCTLNNNGAFYSGGDRADGWYQKGQPSVVMENSIIYYSLDRHLNIVRDTFFCDLHAANFYNSIIYGQSAEEIALHDTNDYAFNYLFQNCIVKYKESDKKDTIDIEDQTHFRNVNFNVDPLFINDSLINGEHDFTLDLLSPAIDSGDINIVNQQSLIQFDYTGKSRTSDGMPDLGAFEK